MNYIIPTLARKVDAGIVNEGHVYTKNANATTPVTKAPRLRGLCEQVLTFPETYRRRFEKIGECNRDPDFQNINIKLLIGRREIRRVSLTTSHAHQGKVSSFSFCCCT